MSKTPTIITLTLPDVSPSEDATLLIQRGNLAHLMLFTALSTADLAAAIETARQALAALEASPPLLPAAASTPGAAARSASVKPASTSKAADSLTIPVGKKTRTIPAYHLHAPREQQAQAVTIAGRLLAGGLWDGLSSIYITDASHTLKALKPLSDKELSLFSLTDFVEVEPPGEDAERELTAEQVWQAGQTVSLVSEAVDEDGELVPFDVGRIVEIATGESGLRLWLESPEGDLDVWVRWDQLAIV